MRKILLLWLLTATTLVVNGQSICSEAVAANSGSNTLPTTTIIEYWYSYTMPSDGKLQITSSSYQKVTIYSNTCNELHYEGDGYQNATATTLKTGDQVFIQWQTGGLGNFEWELGVERLETSDNCNMAVNAEEGINILPETANSGYWYTYTMPDNGKLQITSSTPKDISIFSNNCGNLHHQIWGYQNAVATNLSAGDKVFIQWHTKGEGDFEWELNTMPLEAGDNCNIAATAVEGTNTVPTTFNQKYWYTYTMPSNGKFKVTSSAKRQVSILDNNCESYYYYGSGYDNATATELSEGDEVIILWNLYGHEGFDWELAVEPLSTGDNCELAATATEGTNTLPATTNSEYWYSYTMPEEGKLQITSSAFKNITIYSNTCNESYYESDGYQNVTATALSSGDQVFIQWHTKGQGDFEWELDVVPLEAGDNCNIAATAVEGINTLPTTFNRKYWYTYTMPSDGKLHIASSSYSNITVYSNTCNDIRYEAQGYQNVIATTLKSGDDVLIQWDVYRQDEFDWTLAVVPVEEGDNCELPATAKAGANMLPATINNDYWYTYTMPSDGKLQITSASSKYVSILSGTCGNFSYEFGGDGYQNATATALNQGDEVFIQWNTRGKGDFDWNLEVVPLEAGDRCDMTATATVGNNTLPETANSEYWYAFTMPSSGKLQITSNSDKNLDVYSNSCENKYYEGGGYQNTAIVDLNEGNKIFIVWDTNGEGSFDWELAVLPLEAGDNCGLAVLATEGDNILPTTLNREYWYAYMMPNDGKLQITSSSSEYVSVLSNTCNNLFHQSNGYNNTSVALNKGDEVFIKWDTYSGGNFDWELVVEPLEAGDNCELAVAATTGTNSLPSTFNREYWYTYTMPDEGRLQIISSSYKDVTIYSNTCEELHYKANGHQNATATTLKTGDQVFIQWHTNGEGSFDWELTVKPLEAGDNCELAALATKGNNTLPETLNQHYWYSYTMPHDGKLQINSSSYKSVGIYSNTCDELYYEADGYQNTAATTLNSGDQVFIEWNTRGEGGFEWELNIVPLETGDNCELAAIASEGVNTLPVTFNHKYWYTYTMPKDGKLQVTSASHKNVTIYSNTCSDIQYEVNSHQNAVVTTLSSGDQVFIEWSTNGEGEFDWKLAVVPLEAGDNCELAVEAAEGTNTIPATINQEYWYTYTMSQNGRLEITANDFGYVEVYSNTCKSLFFVGSGYGNTVVTDLNSGEQVFIKWRIYGNEDLDWNLKVAPHEVGDNCENTAIANEGKNSLSATFGYRYWYSYTMPSNGKLEIISESNSNVTIYSNRDSNNCEYLSFKGSGYQNAIISDLSSDEEIFIVWNTYNGSAFDWELLVSPFTEGDNCDQAAMATAGTNSTPSAPYWFEYSVPATGDYTISSVGLAKNDTYLKVYSDCNKTLIDENDDADGLQSELSMSLTAGETIYILWDGLLSPDGFDWTISSDELKGTDQTITFDALPVKTMADTTFHLTATASSGLSVSYTSSDETVATITDSAVTIVGAGTTAITAIQSGSNKYQAAPTVTRKLVVNKVTQSVTIDPIDDQSADASPIIVSAFASSGLALTYSVTGPATMKDGTVTINGTEGIVRVTASQAGNDYYHPASAKVSFTVKPKRLDQVIVFDSLPALTLEDTILNLAATASSNLPVTYVSSNESVAVVEGNTVKIIGTGTATITAVQDGSDTHHPAPPVVQVLTITEGSSSRSTNDCTALVATVAEKSDILCNGSADGRITVAVTGGAAPYSYSIDGTNFHPEARFTALDSGKYKITVKDMNGCMAIVETGISTPDAILVTGKIESSNPDNNSISLSVSGGKGPYTYSWSNGTNTPIIDNLLPGNYNVTVTDVSGCSVSADFSVGRVTAIVPWKEQQVSIYPNPVRDRLIISLPSVGNATKAMLYSLAGRKITEMGLKRGENQLDVSHLKPGSYLLRLNDGSSQRVIVQ
jgi:cytochrome c oxidase assembly protein Cox11